MALFAGLLPPACAPKTKKRSWKNIHFGSFRKGPSVKMHPHVCSTVLNTTVLYPRFATFRKSQKRSSKNIHSYFSVHQNASIFYAPFDSRTENIPLVTAPLGRKISTYSWHSMILCILKYQEIASRRTYPKNHTPEPTNTVSSIPRIFHYLRLYNQRRSPNAVFRKHENAPWNWKNDPEKISIFQISKKIVHQNSSARMSTITKNNYCLPTFCDILKKLKTILKKYPRFQVVHKNVSVFSPPGRHSKMQILGIKYRPNREN